MLRMKNEIGTLNDISLKDEVVFLDKERTDITWESLVLEALSAGVNLSEHAHYAPQESASTGQFQRDILSPITFTGRRSSE